MRRPLFFFILKDLCERDPYFVQKWDAVGVFRLSVHYLRQPNQGDFEKQFAINCECGFPGMLEFFDCMHYRWKNCPVAWQGDYGNRSGKKSIILEAIADCDLYILA